jgi:hypothetical protein
MNRKKQLLLPGSVSITTNIQVQSPEFYSLCNDVLIQTLPGGSTKASHTYKINGITHEYVADGTVIISACFAKREAQVHITDLSSH